MNLHENDTSQQHSMATPLSAIVARAPVSCPPGTPLRSALATMSELKIGSLIVAGEDGVPLGIFTLRDILERVVLPSRSLDEPVSSVMSGNVFAMRPQTSAYEAALAMATRAIRHVLVVDNGRITGLVSEKDLFNLQRVSMHRLAHALREAESVAVLELLSADIRQLAGNMLARGAAAEQITHLIATLNDLLNMRVIELERARAGLDGVRMCWLVLGSQGRYEQTLSSDQDNGIVFDAGDDPEPVRARLLPFARAVNEALARCGFPLCTGNIMASNPQWCLSLPEWRRQFEHWIDSGDPQALLNASIFFDFRALDGDAALVDELRSWLLQRTNRNARFLHQMAANALRNQPPLGWLHDFVTTSDPELGNTIDLKINGATLFTDAARIYSLAHGIAQTNTAARLMEFGTRGGVTAREVQAWIDAFDFIQILRLRRQHAQQLEGTPADNRIRPDDLNALERRVLKEALRQARELQRRLGLDYSA